MAEQKKAEQQVSITKVAIPCAECGKVLTLEIRATAGGSVTVGKQKAVYPRKG